MLFRKYLNFGLLIVKKINKRKVLKKILKLVILKLFFLLYYFNISFPTFLLLSLSKSYFLLYCCFLYIYINLFIAFYLFE